MIFWFSVVVMAISVVKCETNLLNNGDFEDTFCEDWFCIGIYNMERPCTLTSSTLARGGNYSVEVSGRVAEWNGLAQMVNVTPGERYHINAYIQLLNPTFYVEYQTVEIIEMCTVAGNKENRTVAMTPYVTIKEWFEVGGVYKIAAGSEDCMYYVQTDAPMEYVVDDFNLTHIPSTEYEVWESNTDTRIDEFRKAHLNIRLNVNGLLQEANEMVFELEQIRMEFVMGSAVYADFFANDHYLQDEYTQLFYKNFEWGVLKEALSLKEFMKPEANHSVAIEAMDKMISNGIKMRCHSVVTSVEDDIKGFEDYTDTDLMESVQGHAKYLLNLTKGLCDQWDVNDGHLHGDYFERNTNLNFTKELFYLVNSVDDTPRLFLSDSGVISGPEATVAMKNTALKYKAANVPIGGIGVQGHMKDIDYQLLKERLDLLEMTGLPIIITEFEVDERNKTVRAEKLEKLMRLFFSHSAVEGVVLSGFVDNMIHPFDAALFDTFEDENFINQIKANAAGEAYQHLFSSAWRTNETQTLIGHNDVYSTRGFKGQYRLKVKYDGEVLATHNFTLSDGGRNITIHVEEEYTPIVTVEHT